MIIKLLHHSVQYGALRQFGKLLLLILALQISAGFASAKRVTIAALGDSLTQGYGLPAGKGFVPQLQSWLDANGAAADILNAGVSGDTTAGGLARIAWTLTPDIDALIVELGGNDMLRGIDPAVSRRNLAGILALASDRGIPVLLVGLDAPSNFGPDYKTEFAVLYADLADEFATLFFPAFLSPLKTDRDPDVVLQTLMQGDGIHPNGRGVAIIVQAVGPFVQHLIDRVNANAN